MRYMPKEKRKSAKPAKTNVQDLKAKKDPRGGAPSTGDIVITKTVDKGSSKLMP
jgi:hypothetical protein